MVTNFWFLYLCFVLNISSECDLICRVETAWNTFLSSWIPLTKDHFPFMECLLVFSVIHFLMECFAFAYFYPLLCNEGIFCLIQKNFILHQFSPCLFQSCAQDWGIPRNLAVALILPFYTSNLARPTNLNATV